MAIKRTVQGKPTSNQRGLTMDANTRQQLEIIGREMAMAYTEQFGVTPKDHRESDPSQEYSNILGRDEHGKRIFNKSRFVERIVKIANLYDSKERFLTWKVVFDSYYSYTPSQNPSTN
jgi:hypothetical protein